MSVAGLAAASEATVVVVVHDARAAERLAGDVAFFLGVVAPQDGDVNGPVVVMADEDVSPYAEVAPDPRVFGARMAALSRLCNDPPRVFIAPVAAIGRTEGGMHQPRRGPECGPRRRSRAAG